MLVEKRDGRIVPFDKEKIVTAIEGAFVDLDKASEYSHIKAREIANFIANTDRKYISVEEIQDIIEQKLMASQAKDVAKAFIIYRNERTRYRDTKSGIVTEALEVIAGDNGYWKDENSNKNPVLNTTVRDYMAGIVSTSISRNILMTDEIREAHDAGIIHWHDADYTGRVHGIHNCCLINLEDMLQNGTCINKTKIYKPHRLITAMTITTQIITAVASNQYGGCSISLAHLAPFVRSSWEAYIDKYEKFGLSVEQAKELADKDIHKEIEDAVQTFNYQINSMSTTNGQTPFVSVCMYLGETDEYKQELAMLIEEFLVRRLKGMPNEEGVFVTQAFPKLLYFLEEDNIHEDSPFYYLTELSAKCTAKRMNPDYISEKVMKQNKIDASGVGRAYPCMGCRSFLSAYLDENGEPKYYGRFNKSVVTLNLVDIALSSGRDVEKFWELFEERAELLHEAHKIRIETLKNTPSDVAPILWQDGALARLKKGETIDKLLYGGYSTTSFGYAGLYECVKYMTGHPHTDEGVGEKFGLEVMQAILDKCNEWNELEDVGYSPYGTPIESATYRFATKLKERFGDDVFIQIDGHDRNYITNSYHVNVCEPIDPFKKLELESRFQNLSTGGSVSYIEACDLTNNIDVVLDVIKYIYDTIQYAEINSKSDYCHVCGYDGEIKIIDEDGELLWECPNCGNRDKTKMNCVRRTCGYLGSNFWNQGRTNEIQERYVHIDDHAMEV